jgi:hypothetical protein
MKILNTFFEREIEIKIIHLGNKNNHIQGLKLKDNSITLRYILKSINIYFSLFCSEID